MTLCRVVQNPDGTLRIVHPSQRFHQPHDVEVAPATEDTEAVFAPCPGCEEYMGDISLLPEDEQKAIMQARLERTAAKGDLEGLPFVDIDAATLPADRSQREQWRLVDGKVVVDESAPSPLRDAAREREADLSLIEDKNASAESRLQAVARLLR